MRTLSIIAATALALAAPGLARAADDEVSGGWTVRGKVGTFAFVLNCVLERHGDRLGGVCVDDGTNKRHPLTAGAVSGERVTFTYQSNYLVTKFDVGFAGMLKAGQMAGTIHVPGHDGTFTATRS